MTNYSRPYYTLKDGEPVICHDPIEWAMWFERSGNDRFIACDSNRTYQVSTVFLGVDHSFSGDNSPILFETMVFIFDKYHRKGKWESIECLRYATKEEAIEGHNLYCKKYINGD